MKRLHTPSTLAALLFGITAAQAAPLWAPAGLPVRYILDDEEQEEEEDAEEEEGPRWTAVTGGDVYTGLGETLRGATVLSKDGKIFEIGYDLYLPEGTETLNARGLRVYPGMVALSASSRVTQGTLAPEDPDMFLAEVSNEDPDALDWPEDWGPAPTDGAAKGEEVDKGILDNYDPFSQFLVLSLGAGITTVEQSGSAIKLRRNTIEDVVTAEDHLVSMSFGSGEGRKRIRTDFAAAAEYLREYRAWEKLGDDDVDEPSKRGINSAILRVLEGKGQAKFNASTREELLGIARLAQTYDFRPAIFGAREGWIVADELGRAGATIVLTPRDRQWKQERLNADGGSSIENAAKLYAAGCQIAVQPTSGAIDLGGIAGRDLLHLMIEAGFAVRGGLSNQAALEAVTIIPARVLGADHRIGTIEVGKDADLVVTDGDLLHYETFVQYAVVGGEIAYDKNEELYYAHIRPLDDTDRIGVEGEEEAALEAESGDAEGEASEEDGEEETEEESEEEEPGEDEKAGDGEEPEGDTGGSANHL